MGTEECIDCISRSVRSLSSRLPSKTPPARLNLTHVARSATLECMEPAGPAGATLSFQCQLGCGLTFPSHSLCAEATLTSRLKSGHVADVDFIARGSMMRSVT